MLSGLLGKKIGMSHLFAEDGRVVPVTVVEVGPCVVTQVRTRLNDGYEAVQLGFGHAKQLNKPAKGHLRRSQTSTLRYLREFSSTDVMAHEVGETLGVTQFFVGERVHITSNSKGRGFQGVIKRHGFHGGPKTHGQKDRERSPGSIGAGTSPGRVLKGQKMPGHMGNRRVTVQGLRVEMVDADRNVLMIRGAVPGSRNTLVELHHASVAAAEHALAELLNEPINPPESPAEEEVVSSESDSGARAAGVANPLAPIQTSSASEAVEPEPSPESDTSGNTLNQKDVGIQDEAALVPGETKSAMIQEEPQSESTDGVLAVEESEQKDELTEGKSQD